MVYINLISPYTITVKQFQLDGRLQGKELHLTYMTMIDPMAGWFEEV